MYLRHAVATIVLLLCAGCGHSVDITSSLAAYRETPPNVATLGELPSETLSNPTEIRFTIDEHSPMFDFGATGKSYVKMFKLPVATTDYRLVIRSYIMHDGPFKPVLFVPLITFLDADKAPIGTSERKDLDMRDSTLFDEPNDTPRLQFAAIITPQNPARYIIIHTSRQLIEFGMREAAPGLVVIAAAAAVPLFIPAPSGSPSRVPGSPFGDFKLTIEPPRT